MSVREGQVRKNSQLFAELSEALLQRGHSVLVSVSEALESPSRP